jgi:hypothetical protein
VAVLKAWFRRWLKRKSGKSTAKISAKPVGLFP